MFILSAEGETFRDKGNWTMHAILGAFNSLQEATIAASAREESQDETVVMIITEVNGTSVGEPIRAN